MHLMLMADVSHAVMCCAVLRTLQTTRQDP
jgi:hypothetical protein